jgi:hypothetical protein
MWSGSDANQAKEFLASSGTVFLNAGFPRSRYAVTNATFRSVKPAERVISRKASFHGALIGPSVATTSTKTILISRDLEPNRVRQQIITFQNFVPTLTQENNAWLPEKSL